MDNLEKKLNETIQFIEDASKELENGKAVEMQGFQQKVREICEVLASISQSEAEVYIEQMDQLQAALQSFEVDLRQKKADIEVEIKKLNRKQTASTAYEKAKGTETE